MHDMDSFFIVISTVIACSAFLAWLACKCHQPIILGYFICGVLLGPGVLGVVPSIDILQDMSRIGVALLLFLAGLVLHPDRLQKFFRTAVVATMAGSALSWLLVFGFLRAWGNSNQDSALAAAALMFSSTILVVKLLPTTTLHQKRMGSICIAILIAQDLLAVAVLLFVGSAVPSGLFLLLLPLRVALLVALAILGEQHVLRRMMRSADRYNEVLVMLCLGWCVGIALLAERFAVPYEVGAFAAGVAIARGKIALVLSEELKPLRDFFLMFFFFVMGAAFDLVNVRDIWLPALLVSILIVGSRPLWLSWLFCKLGEEPEFSKETAVRLGQASEFALIIAVAGTQGGHLSSNVAQLVQLATVLTMLISSYVVILKYPTPIGVRPGLQRD